MIIIVVNKKVLIRVTLLWRCCEGLYTVRVVNQA